MEPINYGTTQYFNSVISLPMLLYPASSLVIFQIIANASREGIYKSYCSRSEAPWNLPLMSDINGLNNTNKYS